jgi:autotransporter-associated beta strand protein
MKRMFRPLIGLAFVLLALNAHAVAYWNCSSPSGPASGTWNQTNLTWTDDSTYAIGTPTGGPTDPNPKSWSAFQADHAAAFGLGEAQNGIPGAYTVTVDNSEGQVGTSDILVYTGPLTLTGGTLDIIKILNGSPSASSDAGMVMIIHADQIAHINLNITNTIGPYTHVNGNGEERPVFGNKEGTGVLYLGATNTFIGDIAVKSGVLAITVDQSIPSGSSLILLNGSDIGGGADHEEDTPPVFNTGGHNQTFDQLVLDGPNSLIPRTIDFGDGKGSLVFAGNSSTNSWNSSASPVYGDSNPGPLTLVITNFVVGTTKLRFGTDANGLTSAQLAQIQFANQNNAPGKIDASGYVTPATAPGLPVITSVTKVNDSVTLVWEAVNGKTYRVDYKLNLSDATWTALTPNVTASGSTATYVDTTASAVQRFYRIAIP